MFIPNFVVSKIQYQVELFNQVNNAKTIVSNAETFADIRLAITQEDGFTSLLMTATRRLSHSHLSLWPMNINISHRVQPSMKNMGALVVP